MNRKNSFPSNEFEPEIVYLEVLPDRDPQPVIHIQCVCNEEITEYEIAAW